MAKDSNPALGDSLQPLLYMVTTTSVPYMYHLPVILGLPSGIPYWFRYLSQYLHPDLLACRDELLPRYGLLYLRDKKSNQSLCYPIRRFEVLWFERGQAVCFLNLRMARRVAYQTISWSGGEELAIPTEVHAESWRLVAEHVRSLGPTGPTPRTVSIPLGSEPPIVAWDTLKPPGEDERLLWAADGPGMLSRPQSEDAESDGWRAMLPAFAAVENVRKTPFFYLHPPTASTGRIAPKPVVRAGGGRFSGRYSHGFPTRPSITYRLRIDEITPNTFCQDVPTAAPFKLTIADSDVAVQPTVKDVAIDGPYGFYELSFYLDPARAGTTTILRVTTDGLELPASKEAAAGSLPLPAMELPLIIQRRWWLKALWSVGFLAFIVAFVAADQWLPRVGVVPTKEAGTLAKAVLFALALFAAKNAGLDDFAASLEKKL